MKVAYDRFQSIISGVFCRIYGKYNKCYQQREQKESKAVVIDRIVGIGVIADLTDQRTDQKQDHKCKINIQRQTDAECLVFHIGTEQADSDCSHHRAEHGNVVQFWFFI